MKQGGLQRDYAFLDMVFRLTEPPVNSRRSAPKHTRNFNCPSVKCCSVCHTKAVKFSPLCQLASKIKDADAKSGHVPASSVQHLPPLQETQFATIEFRECDLFKWRSDPIPAGPNVLPRRVKECNVPTFASDARFEQCNCQMSPISASVEVKRRICDI